MSSTQFDIKLLMQAVGFDEAWAAMDKLNKSTDELVASQAKGTKSTQSFGQTISKQKTGLLQLGTSFGTVTAAGWSLYNAYDSLEKVKMASQRADTKVKTAMLAVQDAQQKLTVAIAKYGAGSSDAAEASAELAVKQEQLANAQEIAAIRSEDVSEAFAQFATTLPTMVLSVVSAGTAFGTMVQQMGGIHKIAPMVSSAFQAVGGGIKSLMLAGGGLGLLLTVIATAFILLATNAFGVRDAFNAFGKAVGDAIPFLKPLLDLIGGAANWFLNLINPMQQASAQLDALGTSATGATTPIGSVETALTTLEQQAVATGDATKLSIENQITLYKQLGTEAETLQLALTAQLQLRTEAEEEHSEKYAEFVEAMEDEDEKLRDSMGLTKEEFDKFYEEWQKDIDDFAKNFSTQVATIVKNFETFETQGRKEQTTTAEKILEIEKAIQEAYLNLVSAKDLSDEAYDEQIMKIQELEREHARLMGSMSKAALDAAMDFKDFSQIGIESMASFQQEALGGNFQEAIKAIQNAMDNVPDKYKGNFDRVATVLDNAYLSAGSKADIFVTKMDKLNPFQSFTVGAHEYTLAQAEAAAGIDGLTLGLDELGTTARRHVTDTGGMSAAWDAFVASMSPAQKQLPIVKSAIEGVNSGALTTSEAFAMVEAAGVKMSAALGETVTQSFESLKKTVIDLPGPTKAVFVEMGGSVVKLGEVADTELVSGAKSFTKSMTTTEEQAATLGTGVDTALGKKAPEAIKKMVTDGAAEFKKMTANMKTLTTDVEGESVSIVGAFVKIGTQIGTAWDSTITYLKSAWDGFVKWIQSFKLPELNFLPEAEQGKGMQKSPSPGYTKSAWTPGGPQLQGEVMFGTTQKDTQTLGAAFVTLATVISTAMKTIITQIGVFATTTKTQFTALGTALTALGTAFTTVGTTITTAMTTANTQIGVFSTTTKTQFTAVTVAITALGTAFTTLGTTVTTAMTTLNTQVGVFSTTTKTQFTAVGTAITTLQTAFTTLSTTVTTAMTTANTQVGVFTTTTVAQFAKVGTSMKTLQTASSTLSTTIATHMKSMTTNVNSFASAFTSAMNKVVSDADKATKAVNALKSAVDALKSKTITVTVNLSGPGVDYLQHGGAFITGLAGQHGYSGIVSSPGKIGGVKVGEGFRPELITVTPLTRGTGNHYGATMGGGFGSPGGRGGGEVTNNITVVLDGRVIQRFVEKTALAGIGVQI